MSDDVEQPMPGDYFPKALPKNEKFVKRLGGFDIFKDAWSWWALVATEDTTKHKKSVKWYRWTLTYGNWTVGKCNIDVHHLDFKDLKRKIDLLKEVYQIN